jgi:hypothetical protein
MPKVAIARSTLPKAGRGVFNDSGEKIPVDTAFGPYPGVFVPVAEYRSQPGESGYAWELLDEAGKEVIGAVDPGSNPDPQEDWMAMVNSANRFCKYLQNAE